MRSFFLTCNALLLLFAIIALMGFFTAGAASGQVLVLVLLAGLPLAALAAIHATLRLLRKPPLQGVPNWLKFGSALSLALLFCAELALLVTSGLGASAPLYLYLPVVTGTLAVLAFDLQYAARG